MIHIEYLDFIMDINVNDGMNISYLSWKTKTLIKRDFQRQSQGHTYGMPLMFPTPNRTRNNRYRYKGKEYAAKMHGLFRNLPFIIVHNSGEQDSYKVTGVLKWDASYEEFDKYPFDCILKIHIIIQRNRLIYQYEITNTGEASLPYGFGIHPFFENPRGDAKIMTEAKKILKSQNSINTGEIQEVKETDYALSRFKPVNALKLDTVYMMENNMEKLFEVAVIQWDDYQLSMSCSNDFSHLVIYTPENYDKFCIEPQTCSIDALNLYDKGYKEVSGVQEVEKNETKLGTIQFSLSE